MKKRIRVNGVLYEAADKDNLKNVKIPGYGRFIEFDSEAYDDEEDMPVPLAIESSTEDWDTLFDDGATCDFFVGNHPDPADDVYFSFFVVCDNEDDDYSWHFLCSDGCWYYDYRGYSGTTWAPKKDPMNKKDAISLYNKAAKIMSGEYDFGSVEAFCKEVDKRSAKLLSSLGMRETDYYLPGNYDNRTKNVMWDVDIPKFESAKRIDDDFRGDEAYVELDSGDITFYTNSDSGYVGKAICDFGIEEDDGEYYFSINFYSSLWEKDGLTEDEAINMFDRTAKIMSDSYPLNDEEWFVETVEKNVKKVVRQLGLKKS